MSKMKFNISHERNGVYQTLLVEATTPEIAEAYFKEQKPENRLIGVREARPEDLKPGKPVMVVSDEFRLGFIREHQRAFNEKMAGLEKQGFRSGGWDEKTDKTAIVKVGDREIDNVIVGYMDRDLNIEWLVKVLAIGRADEQYLEGAVFVEGEVYVFDYNLGTEGVELHCYSEPGWMTGASYEKPLSEVVNEHMEEIYCAIIGAVEDWLEAQGYVKLSENTVDALLSGAEERAVTSAGGTNKNDKDMEM